MQLSKGARNLLAIHTVTLTAMIGSKLFVNTAFVKGQSSYDAVFTFQFVFNALIALVFYFIARRCKEQSFLGLFRAGFLAYLAFLLCFAYFGPASTQAAFWFGLLYGAAAGLYWLPFHLYKLEFNRPELRLRFFSFEALIERVLGIVCPVIFGWIISASGSYTVLFTLLALLFIAMLPTIAKLHEPKEHVTERYDLERLIKLLPKTPDLIKVLFAMLLFGATFIGVMDVLLVLFIYERFQSELALGILFSIVPILELTVTYFVKRLKNSQFPTALIAISTLLLGASFALLISTSLTTLIILQVVFSISVPVLIILQNVYSFNVLDTSKEILSLKVEFFVLRECMLGLGRPLGFFIAACLIWLNVGFAWTLCILSMLSFIGVLVVRRVKLAA